MTEQVVLMAYILQELIHSAFAAAVAVPTGQIKLRLQVATEKKHFTIISP